MGLRRLRWRGLRYDGRGCGSFDGGDLGLEGSGREAGANLLARLGFGGGAEQGFAGAFEIHEGVAAVENGEWRQGFETRGELVETGRALQRNVVGVAPEGLGGLAQPVPRSS